MVKLTGWRVWVIVVFYLMAAAGCSDSAAKKNEDIIDPVGTRDPLQDVSYAGNVLVTERRFISYSRLAGRVSLIDPELPREVWGRQQPGYDVAVALPDFSGAVLFNDTEVKVMAGDQTKTFALQSEYVHTAVAPGQAGYSLSSADGTSFEVIRALGDGQWQQQQFNVPWSDDIADTVVTKARLVTRFNHDGSQLLAFYPADGRYAVYRVSQDDALLQGPDEVCAGDGTGQLDDPHFRSITLQDGGNVFFIGDQFGRVFALDTDQGCVDTDLLPRINLTAIQNVTGGEVIGLAGLGGAELAALLQSEQGGVVQRLTFNNGAFTWEQQYDNVCGLPLDAVKLADGKLVVMCLEVNDANGEPDFDSRFYVTLDTETGEILRRVTRNKNDVAAVAVDPGSNRMYTVHEGAFGKLDILQLSTGETLEHAGLYIEDLLNQP